MIDQSTVVAVAAALELQGNGAAAQQALTERFPQVRFTWCSDDDVSSAAKPVGYVKGFNIYLVGGGTGCLALTDDFGNAAGVVVAEVMDEEA